MGSIKSTGATIGIDEFPADQVGELAQEHDLISRFLEENREGDYLNLKLKSTESGRTIHALEPDLAVRLVRALVARLPHSDQRVERYRQEVSQVNAADSSEDWQLLWTTKKLLDAAIEAVMRRKLPFSAADLEPLGEHLGAVPSARLGLWSHPVRPFVNAVEQLDGDLSPELRDALHRLNQSVIRQSHDRDWEKLGRRVEALLGQTPEHRVQPGEAWSDRALADLSAMAPTLRSAWIEIVNHAQSATSSKPTQKWDKRAQELLDKIDSEELIDRLTTWFALVDKPRTDLGQPGAMAPEGTIIDSHADILKGLVWSCRTLEDPRVSRALCALTLTSYKKIPGLGPRLVRVGNAAVYALGMIPTLEAVGRLAYLKVRVKFKTGLREIDKALTRAADRMGLPKDELEEISVPAYGLTEVGRTQETLGDFTAELQVVGTQSVTLTWVKADGKRQKSIPAAIKERCAEEIKDLKQAAKDIQKMLPAQRDRIDRLYLSAKDWSLETWRERYLDHPLVGTIARRLVWTFEWNGLSRTGCFWEGEIVDSVGEVVPVFEANGEVRVRLWHPIESLSDEILAWRHWFETREVRQPFKQAHREVYLLTDAERRTRLYSNRFAAHILKQHQFNALCANRGWRNSLRLLVDDSYPPASIDLPVWNLRAEYWIEGVGDNYEVDTNETGTFYYIVTDQVRFYRLEAPQSYAHASGGGYDPSDEEPVPIEEVKPLALSEVLRDVDLFVGVASVGNDPNWSDGGPEGRYYDYWQQYSFGDLSEVAEARKATLARLIPRLKIAGRATVEDRFLRVKGDLRTYKIHLRSGNILMEPDDQYLCIVQKSSAKSAADKVFLPFEGDGMLSIILSKAFLLAEDKKIKDETILSQIKRG